MRYLSIALLLLGSCVGGSSDDSSSTTNTQTSNTTPNPNPNPNPNPSGHSEVLTYSNTHPLSCDDTRIEITSKEDEVFNLTNNYRIASGLSALAKDEPLRKVIRGHCHHMYVENFFAHTNPEGDDPFQRASKCGTSANGENIAKGYTTAQSVFDGWKASPGHNENMLRSFFTALGVGFYDQGYHWGQLFR